MCVCVCACASEYNYMCTATFLPMNCIRRTKPVIFFFLFIMKTQQTLWYWCPLNRLRRKGEAPVMTVMPPPHCQVL